MLTSPQLRLLHRNLLDAFSERELEDLVQRGIGVPIDRLVAPGTSISGKASEIIQAAERAGWTRELVQAAYDAKPVVPAFAELYQALGLGSNISPQQAGIKTGVAQKSTALGFDQLTNSVVDIGRWRERLATVEACVCRIEVGTTAMATGFLVAPDIVATCYHVMEPVFAGLEKPANVRVRFDYRVVGSVVTPGVIVELDRGDWDVNHSPFAASDMQDATAPPPSSDQLDYALLRLTRSIGAEPRDPSTDGGPRRGWLQLPATDPLITVGMPLMIAQYTSGGPLTVAFDTDAVRGFNQNQTRVLYATNTQPGAAGAPCFDINWELVAIHQAVQRGPDGKQLYGQGVAISAIRKHLEDTGNATLLAAPPLPDTVPALPSSDTRPPPPAEILHEDDPQKGRWGGLSERNGRKLTVKINEVQRTRFMFDAVVTSTDGSPLRPPVFFHLHDSYPRSVIRITKIRNDEQTAGLYEVQSSGVYVIGVQVKDAAGTWIGLELDLATAADLPAFFLTK